MSHVCFTCLRDFMTALHQCYGDGEDLFPETVFQVPGKGWAIAESVLNAFAAKATQFGWKFQRLSPPPGGWPTVRLATLVAGLWKRYDPFRFRYDGRPVDAVVCDPFDPKTEYILGARSEEEARELLGLLTAHLVAGIQAVPLVSKGAGPFHFFWVVASDFLPLDILVKAPKAWWGPAGAASRAAVYLQWPWSLEVDAALLQRVPWGDPSAIILLNREEPKVLLILPWGDRGPAVPLVEVSKLWAGGLHTLQADSTPNETRFDVEMLLVPGGPRKRLKERIARLQSEQIERERVLESLRDELAREREESPPPEPLLLYYHVDDSEVPLDIQRLLVEWTGLSGDLEAVEYQKLDSSQFPAGLDHPYPMAHVLTSAKACGLPQSDPSLGARLATYVPSRGARVWFDLLPEWEKAGLRLFVPHGEALELYPRLAPNQYSAAKLARALMGPAATRAGEFLVLLVRNQQGSLTSCLIPAARFRPLAQVFDWECALDVAKADAVTVESVMRETKEAFFGGLAQALEQAIAPEAEIRLGWKKQELRDRLNSYVKQTEDRSRALEKLRTALENVSLFDSLEEALQVLSGELDKLAVGARSASLESAALSGSLSAVERIERRLIAAKRAVQKLNSDVTRLQKEIVRLSSR